MSTETGLRALLARDTTEQRARGYVHTVREIAQQPATWLATAALVQGRKVQLGGAPILLTGSGSSCYIGECLAPALQEALACEARAVAAGDLLTHPRGVLPPLGSPLTLISLARSGDSPESWAAAEAALCDRPGARHIVITCNLRGTLAMRAMEDLRSQVIVLDEATCDRSLVMTSSFTNMLVAGLTLAGLGNATALAGAAAEIIAERSQALAALAGRDLRSAVYLGSGPHFGAAREGMLKMVEMTAGAVSCIAETYLGLRHGPMSALRRETLVVAFLSSDPARRRYELDLLADLTRRVGPKKLIVGAGVPRDLARDGDVIIDVGTQPTLSDAELPVIDVVVAQLLALFRCLAEGLSPDAPSRDNVIHRVVERFPIYAQEQP